MYIAGATAYLAGLAGVYLSYDSSAMEQRLNLIGSCSSAIFFIMNCSTILEVVSGCIIYSHIKGIVLLSVSNFRNLFKIQGVSNVLQYTQTHHLLIFCLFE